ncbi:hypothetical protein [Streptomyces pactum]|uniref:hypothetical protein n=1 Tax=Streptomyces pactum TaxID=68249 RepID=UPI001E646AB6|nr:hypothetical protein [Streptomyces pactum]
MNTAGKITAFTAVLAASFGAAYGVGHAVDPVTSEETSSHAGHRSPGAKGSGDPGTAGAAHAPGGLQIAENGYRLDLQTPRVEAGKESELRFAVLGRDGRPLTGFRAEHGKELHLIVSARDLTTYRHLHPTRAADGTWSTRVELPRAGDYRLFADFTPGGKGTENLTLGADLAVGGTYRPATLPEPGRTATVDGYTVTLDGELRPGAESELTLSVSRKGRPVTDLDPYLGAYGHLVALRGGDLGYLHVHPGGEPGDGSTRPGPDISFIATAPSAGTYRLFLDFKHEGTVRTAAFTVRTGAGEEAGPGRTDADAGQEKQEKGDAGERKDAGAGHSADGHGH